MKSLDFIFINNFHQIFSHRGYFFCEIPPIGGIFSVRDEPEGLIGGIFSRRESQKIPHRGYFFRALSARNTP